MPDFTFFEVHFHEFNPTNTAPLIGRGGSSRELDRGASTDPSLDGVPVEGAETDPEATDDSGGPGVGVAVALLFLVAVVIAVRKFRGGDDELAELEEIDEVA